MTTTETRQKRPNNRDSLKDIPICAYKPCFFEKLFLCKKLQYSPNVITERWGALRTIAFILYCILLVAYYVIIGQSANAMDSYNQAAPVVASIIFWPFIIVYNSELFYRLFQNLYPILRKEEKCNDWYNITATKGFTFCCATKIRYKILSILHFLISVLMLLFISARCVGWIPEFANEIWCILAIVFISGVICYFSKESRNINIVFFVTCCGLAYYSYVLMYSPTCMPFLFESDSVIGNFSIVILAYLIFFISGSTVYPMVQLVMAFYGAQFEELIEYPINNISQSLNKINKIKEYFFHLTGINVFAFFQLFGSAYLLGIVNKEDILTRVLFVLGSLFPLIMYLSTNVFFRNLCNKIYANQVKQIDEKIYQCVHLNEIEPEKVQSLISVKEMYASEFEIHTEMNREVLMAMFTPIGTAILGLILPFIK